MRYRNLLLVCGIVLASAGGATASPLLHWEFDQVQTGNTTPDASGNHYTGNLIGPDSSDLVPGAAGNALRFQGDTSNYDRVELPDASAGALDATFTQFTVSM